MTIPITDSLSLLCMVGIGDTGGAGAPLGVVPILIGPIQVLLALLPAIGAAIVGVVFSLFKPATAKKLARLLWRLKYFVVATAAVVVGAVYLAGAVFPHQGARVSEAEKSGRDWPAFRGGLGRRGYVPGAPSPTEGGVNWAFTAEKTFHSSPAVVGNRVYVTSASKGVFADTGTIYCLDADTGGVAWKCSPKGYLATFSSPSVQGKYLVCGEGLHFTRDARIVCLDVSRQGKLLWEYRTNSHVESSAAIDNERAYIGAGDDGYYCFELEPDADGKAKLVWHVSGKDYPDAETSPAVADGKVYVGLGVRGNAVCCLNARDGKQVWRTPTPYPVFTPPTLAAGRVYVGMGNGNFIKSAEEVRADEIRKLKEQGKSAQEIAEAEKSLAPAGEVWCLNAADGKVQWTFKAERTILGAVAADGNRLYFATRGGKTYCISTDGKEIASWDAYGAVMASPAVSDRYVYFLTEAGRLYTLDKESFRPVCEKALGATGPFLSSPVVARGHVYVGSPNDGFLCVGQPGGEKADKVWSGALGGPGKTGLADSEPLPERAAMLWRFPPKPSEGEDPEGVLAMTAPAAVLPEAIYVPVADGPHKGLLCLRNDPCSREAPAVLWHFPLADGVSVSPAANGSRVFVVSGRSEQKAANGPPRSLFCLDAPTGKELLRRPVAPDATGEFVFTGRFLVIQDAPDTLTCLDADGKEQWHRRLGPLGGPPAWSDMILVAAVGPSKEPARPEGTVGLVALDLPTGQTLWRVQMDRSPTTGPAIQDNVIYLGAGKGLAARSLLDGKALWRVDAGPVKGRFVADRKHLAYFSTGGELVVLNLNFDSTSTAKEITDKLDRRKGLENLSATEMFEAAQKWRVKLKVKVKGAAEGIGPLLTRDGVVYASSQGLMLHEFASDRARRWMSTSLSGNVTSPIVAANSRVYFGSQRRGLVCGGRWQQ